MAFRVGHAPLGKAGAWLIRLADPAWLSRSLSLPPPIAPSLIPHLVEAAFAHGVAPTARRHLRGFAERSEAATLIAGPAASEILNDALAGLDRRRILVAGQSLLLSHHASRITSALRDARLAATVVKGVTFSHRLYPHPSERSFTDIDVLLNTQAVGPATAVLRELGYAPASEWDAQDNDRREMKWLLPGNDVLAIELQTDLIHSENLRSGIRFGYDEMMAAGDGDPLDATAQLLVAAIHGAAGHQFERLQPAVDTVQAARGVAGPISRERMLRVAHRIGIGPALQSALDVVARLFDEPAARILADALGSPPWRGVRSRLLSPAIIARSQARTGWLDSWRRRSFREAIRRSGHRSVARVR